MVQNWKLLFQTWRQPNCYTATLENEHSNASKFSYEDKLVQKWKNCYCALFSVFSTLRRASKPGGNLNCYTTTLEIQHLSFDHFENSLMKKKRFKIEKNVISNLEEVKLLCRDARKWTFDHFENSLITTKWYKIVIPHTIFSLLTLRKCSAGPNAGQGPPNRHFRKTEQPRSYHLQVDYEY